MSEKMAYQIDEAAKTIGVCRAKVYQLVKAGELHTFKLAGRTLIRREVLQALIDRASQTPPKQSTPRAA